MAVDRVKTVDFPVTKQRGKYGRSQEKDLERARRDSRRSTQR
jgi:hypothetical protein